MSELRRIHEALKALPTKEKVLAHLTEVNVKNPYQKTHMIFSMDQSDKRESFYEALSDKSWQRKQAGTDSHHYDYILFKDVHLTPEMLYDELANNNGDTIIFDSATLLSSERNVELLSQAVYVHPEHVGKQRVTLPAREGSIFTGQIFILTDISLEKFKRQRKFHYLHRYCRWVEL